MKIKNEKLMSAGVWFSFLGAFFLVSAPCLAAQGGRRAQRATNAQMNRLGKEVRELGKKVEGINDDVKREITQHAQTRDAFKAEQAAEFRKKKRFRRWVTGCALLLVGVGVSNVFIQTRHRQFFQNGGVHAVQTETYDEESLVAFNELRQKPLSEFFDEDHRMAEASRNHLLSFGAAVRETFGDKSPTAFWKLFQGAGVDVSESEMIELATGDLNSRRRLDERFADVVATHAEEARDYTSPSAFESMTVGSFYTDILLPVAEDGGR